jgi:hypothetical protein
MSPRRSRVTRRGWSRGAPPLSRAALAAFLVAVLSLAALALSGLGSQWGWWHFGTGFSILRWSAYAGGVAALMAVVGLVLASLCLLLARQCAVEPLCERLAERHGHEQLRPAGDLQCMAPARQGGGFGAQTVSLDSRRLNLRNRLQRLQLAPGRTSTPTDSGSALRSGFHGGRPIAHRPQGCSFPAS